MLGTAAASLLVPGWGKTPRHGWTHGWTTQGPVLVGDLIALVRCWYLLELLHVHQPLIDREQSQVLRFLTLSWSALDLQLGKTIGSADPAARLLEDARSSLTLGRVVL